MTEINETVQKKESLGKEIGHLLKSNLRDYMMYIVLILIIIYFSVNTDGKFITANNISNLLTIVSL